MKQRGFSLIELMISVLIFSCVMGVIYSYLKGVKKDTAVEQSQTVPTPEIVYDITKYDICCETDTFEFCINKQILDNMSTEDAQSVAIVTLYMLLASDQFTSNKEEHARVINLLGKRLLPYDMLKEESDGQEGTEYLN